jgi:hypothetical protein
MSDRQARVSDSGCGIYLTPGELRTLGVDPEDADQLAYTVTESGLIVAEPDGGDE